MAYDLVVVGGGPAGVAAVSAGVLAGARVGLVERGLLGGTCVHRGCVPNDVMLESARRFHQARAFAGEGVRAPLDAIQAEASRVVSRMTAVVTNGLGSWNVDVIQGRASLARGSVLNVVSPRGELNELGYSGLVIASGAQAYVPDVEIVGQPKVLTAVEAMALSAVPESIVIVVGGRLGLEWASYFHHLGSRVTVVESGDVPRAADDPEIAGFLQGLLEQAGIAFVVSARAVRVEAKGGRAVLHLDRNGTSSALEADAVMFADFRKPVLDGFISGPIGLAVEDGFLRVDAEQRTSEARIFAAGDIAGGLMLANKARLEGEVAGANACGGHMQLDRLSIPRALHTAPQLAEVGLTAAAAEREGYTVAIGYADAGASPRALALGAEHGILKLVVDKRYGAILGASALGADATETIALLSFAMRMEATVEDLAASHHVHPAMSEMVVEAARAVQR